MATRYRSCLKHCAVSRKATGSIPYGAIIFLIDLIISAALSQPRTEMITRHLLGAGGEDGSLPTHTADNLTAIC